MAMLLIQVLPFLVVCTTATLASVAVCLSSERERKNATKQNEIKTKQNKTKTPQQHTQ
jgi:hypothetical protein